MKTGQAYRYLLKCRLDLTAWGKTIIRAESMGTFIESDRHRACCWVTCACGRANAKIEMGFDGPLDGRLHRLGLDFGDAVYRDDFMKAAELLVAIEERAEKLLVSA